MDRIIFHIDVNSAFLSWTAAERLKQGIEPDLRTIPAIIGGNRENRHGIVLAKSIAARRFGIHTGEPVAQALQKCPNLVIVPPDHALYSRCSQRLMAYLHTITPDIEQVSIDECYLDFTPIATHYDTPFSLAHEIQDHIRTQFGFTVNIGIAPNKLLAKMASDFEKPNKIHTLFPDEIPRKMWPLPVESLFMTGRSSVKRLKELGIFTIGELAHTDCAFLISEFKSHGKQMWDYANGIDDTQLVAKARMVKGVGNSVTLAHDVNTLEESLPVLLSLAESVGARLRSNHQIAGSVTVEIRYHDFINVSHQMQLRTPSNTTHSIYQAACQLFKERWNGAPIRLLGIRTAKLQSENSPVQLSLFDLDPNFAQQKTSALPAPRQPSLEKQKKADAALDAIREKFGEQSVVRGSLLSVESKQRFVDRKHRT